MKKIMIMAVAMFAMATTTFAAEENTNATAAYNMNIKKSGETDSEEYADLSTKSKGLQDIIDKWRPIYLERMEMVKSVKMAKRKRTQKK